MTQQAQMSQNTNTEKVGHTYFGAYPARDGAAIESVMAEDFQMTDHSQSGEVRRVVLDFHRG